MICTYIYTCVYMYTYTHIFIYICLCILHTELYKYMSTYLCIYFRFILIFWLDIADSTGAVLR